MKVVSVEKRLCTCCMEEHDVKIIHMQEKNIFKNVELEYEAEYCYCDIADEMYMLEKQMRNNDIRMKDAYRKKMGLLLSGEICKIRSRYGISQSDLCTLLGWGAKTITRYESCQVQDKAHNSILKKLASDPEWFISLLKESEGMISQEAYHKYLKRANDLYSDSQEIYLKKAIGAMYAGFHENKAYQGNQELALDKAVDAIGYLSDSSNVTELSESKLMQMLWYADYCSYQLRNHAITGLAYQSMQIGIVPIGTDLLFDLSGVAYDFIDNEDGTVYQFSPCRKKGYKSLSEDDKKVLDTVILKMGKKTKAENNNFINKEKAYMNTPLRSIILFD